MSVEESVFDRYRADVDRPLRRLFGEYGMARFRWFAVGMVANTVARFASLVPPLVLGTAIDAVFNEGTYSLLLVPEAWIPSTDVGQFWFSVALIVGAFGTTAVFTWVYGVTANLFAHGVMHDVRTDSFDKMQRLDMSFFDDKQTGELMTILNDDAGNLELFLDNALMNSARLVVMVVGIAAILFSLNAQLAFVTLVVVPVMFGFTWWFMRAVTPRYRDRQKARARFNTRIENAIAGVELTKTTASEDHERDRVHDASHTLYDRIIHLLRLTYVYQPGMELLAGLSFAATFVVGGYWLFTGTPPGPLTGTLTVGTFVTFLFMTQRFVTPLAEVSNIVDQVENATVSAERIFGLADIPVHVTDPDDPVPLDDPAGRVEYDDVTFAYSETPGGNDGSGESGGSGGSAGDTDASTAPDGGLVGNQSEGPAVIHDVSFAAEPGETVALVGPTGAGKSTLVKLLLRLYDVTEGAVRVDGHDVRELAMADLRGSVGYVSQDTFLFDGTIADNVRYGRFDASMDAVREAARAAEAHAFIERLPDGYETRVGERGVKLSGGQRQRISIARVVLRDPAILVLDEATSAVDTETELLIQRSLDRLAADRTTIAIAHRLSTVRDADQILVVEDGRIVERGTHDELLDRDERYASLWSVQAGDLDSLPDSFRDRVARADRRADRHATDDGDD